MVMMMNFKLKGRITKLEKSVKELQETFQSLRNLFDAVKGKYEEKLKNMLADLKAMNEVRFLDGIRVFKSTCAGLFPVPARQQPSCYLLGSGERLTVPAGETCFVPLHLSFDIPPGFTVHISRAAETGRAYVVPMTLLAIDRSPIRLTIHNPLAKRIIIPLHSTVAVMSISAS
ncbi:hypothetical protein L2E82_49980 [Cichorium intybus]|nr:hypothetical protein L2E82_49980 [Cichorium intybus]